MALGYDPHKRCIKCNQRQGYLYYCGDCGGIVCNDCVISEKTECTFCNNCSHISIGNKCEKCGEKNQLTAAKRFIRKCPICSSTKIKDLDKKISQLPEEFNDIIDVTLEGLELIRTFSKKYSETIKEAKYLRREKFGLYPEIENKLIRIQGEFFEITSRAAELLDKVYEQIRQDTRSLSLYQRIAVENLPRIDRRLRLIHTHVKSYTNLINDFLKSPRKELDEVIEYTSELQQFSSVFDSISDKLAFDAMEYKIAAVQKVRAVFPKNRFKRIGKLFLTIRRLYFIQRFRLGFSFNKKVKTIAINQIRSIETKNNKIFGARVIIHLPGEKRIVIKCSDTEQKMLNFLFGVLFNNNEGYLINDPYLLEELPSTLNYGTLKEKFERRIKDMKQLAIHDKQDIPSTNEIRGIIRRESEKVKQLRIELRAAKDTLRQLIRAFDDRSITPEVYFSRRERTQQRIISLEERIKETLQEQQRNSQLTSSLNQFEQYPSYNYERR